MKKYIDDIYTSTDSTSIVTTEKQMSKLPKWARNLIDILYKDLCHLKHELDKTNNNGWVYVKDGLPEPSPNVNWKSEKVLVCSKEGEISFGICYLGGEGYKEVWKVVTQSSDGFTVEYWKYIDPPKK